MSNDENMGVCNSCEDVGTVSEPVAVTDAVEEKVVQKNYARKYTKGSKMVMMSLRIPESYKVIIKKLADSYFEGNMTGAILKAVDEFHWGHRCGELCPDQESGGESGGKVVTCIEEKKPEQTNVIYK